MAELILPAGEHAPELTGGSIFFIGNATVLIRYGGLTILTDPTFIHMHEQVSIGYGMHSTRLTNPAMEISDLPPLDLIVLSHFHGDHFDQVAERELRRTLPIITTGEASRELGKRGFTNTHPLDHWSAMDVSKGEVRLRVTSMPGRHGPPLADFVLPDVMGTMLEFGASNMHPFRLYITGDTLLIDEISEIALRYPEIDLALLHLGGTRVLGVLVTMDADQGLELFRTVDPKRAIPIHFNDYDVFKSPLSEFKDKIDAAGLGQRVHYLSHGETYDFSVSRGAVETSSSAGLST